MKELILISGPPGCGKSTFTDALAPKIRAFVLDKDCIDDLFSPNDRGAHYTKEIEPKVLQGLLNLAERNLNLGHSVIIDVPWTHIMLNSPEWVEKNQTLAQKTGAELIVLECTLSEETLRKRLAMRGLKRDQAKLTPEGWENFKKHDRIGAKNPLPHFVINVEDPVKICLKKALEFLRNT